METVGPRRNVSVCHALLGYTTFASMGADPEPPLNAVAPRKCRLFPPVPPSAPTGPVPDDSLIVKATRTLGLAPPPTNIPEDACGTQLSWPPMVCVATT